MFDNVFFENRTVYEIMWKNVVERGRLQETIWRMRIACWMPKATDTHSQYVILIAFPLQQWLHKLALMLRYTLYIASLVLSSLSRQTMQQWHEKLQAYVAFIQILHIYIYIYIYVCVCVCVCVWGEIINIKPHWNAVNIGVCSLAAHLSQLRATRLAQPLRCVLHFVITKVWNRQTLYCHWFSTLL